MLLPKILFTLFVVIIFTELLIFDHRVCGEKQENTFQVQLSAPNLSWAKEVSTKLWNQHLVKSIDVVQSIARQVEEGKEKVNDIEQGKLKTPQNIFILLTTTDALISEVFLVTKAEASDAIVSVPVKDKFQYLNLNKSTSPNQHNKFNTRNYSTNQGFKEGEQSPKGSTLGRPKAVTNKHIQDSTFPSNAALLHVASTATIEPFGNSFTPDAKHHQIRSFNLGGPKAGVPTEDDVTVRVGEPVIFRIVGMPSTGYVWLVDNVTTSKSLLVGSLYPTTTQWQPDMKGRTTEQDQKRGVIFEVKVTATVLGDASLYLIYRQPFIVTSASAKKVVRLHASTSNKGVKENDDADEDDDDDDE